MAKTSVTVRAAWITGTCVIFAAIIGLVVLIPTKDKSFEKDKAYSVYQKMAQYHHEIKIAAHGYQRDFHMKYQKLYLEGLTPGAIIDELESQAHRSVTIDCHNLIPELNLLFPRDNKNYWKDKVYFSYGIFERIMNSVNQDYRNDNMINSSDEINLKFDSLDSQLTALVAELKSDLDKMK